MATEIITISTRIAECRRPFKDTVSNPVSVPLRACVA